MDKIQNDIAKEGWLALGVGLPLAALCCAFDTLRFLCSYLSILIHEIGHSATALCFGYYSIPTFNFSYGGGMAYTNLEERHYWLIALVAAGLLYALWTCRGKTLPMIFLVLVAAVYAYLCATSAHVALMLFMGHGAELVFSGIFLYRAISGQSIVNGLERPLYAFVGFFMEFNSGLFAYKIVHDPVERILYEEGLNLGGHVNDFVALANDSLHCGFETVAQAFLIACLLPPILAFLFHHYREHLLCQAPY